MIANWDTSKYGFTDLTPIRYSVFLRGGQNGSYWSASINEFPTGETGYLSAAGKIELSLEDGIREVPLHCQFSSKKDAQQICQDHFEQWLHQDHSADFPPVIKSTSQHPKNPPTLEWIGLNSKPINYCIIKPTTACPFYLALIADLPSDLFGFLSNAGSIDADVNVDELNKLPSQCFFVSEEFAKLACQEHCNLNFESYGTGCVSPSPIKDTQ
jgi:hypothetical protein